jgi:hypothetical protein
MLKLAPYVIDDNMLTLALDPLVVFLWYILYLGHFQDKHFTARKEWCVFINQDVWFQISIVNWSNSQ